jgi:8-oxo-dGTP pyrophosphatase MutT (NUDIX family)
MFEAIRYSNEKVSAFNSLSFKGKRGYGTNLVTRKKQSTYGGILYTKDTSGMKYALVQGRYTGKWSFPKGHSNEGEEPLECTLREVGEETGIDTLPEPTEYIKIGYGNYYVFYLKEAIPLKARDKKEIMNTKWVSVEEMEEMDLNADASMFVRKLKSDL